MDFQVPAPGGVGPGQPAALTARGADPAIYIPAGSHFFRRVTGLVLQPVPPVQLRRYVTYGACTKIEVSP
jgi:hypothetical protein